MAPEGELTSEERDYYALNRMVYDRLARWYDLVALPLTAIRREVARRGSIGPAMRVLDVATGTGGQAAAFAETRADVVGVDISDAMLRIARAKHRRANLEFRRGDATRLPFEDDSFDASCISFALHEMPLRIRERALREMARVTRPGGTVIVVDYGLPHGHWARELVYRGIRVFEREHYGEFVHSDLDNLLDRAGITTRDDRRVRLGAIRIVIGFKGAAAPSRPTATAA